MNGAKMKQNFFVKRCLRFATWTMAHISWMTMAFSPVALGQQAENIKAQDLKFTIQALNLNKKMTVKEFWEKTKAEYPGYAYYEIEEFIKQNPKALMPQFEVRTVKGSKGQEVPVITFTDGGKTHSVQIFGDEKNYLKFNGITVSEAESTQPSKIFQKLIDNDSKLKKQYNDAVTKTAVAENRTYRTEMKPKATTKNKGRFSSFNGFARVTPQMWASMSKFDRAQYLVQMRMVWTEARKVNFISDQQRSPASQPSKKPRKKTSSLENMYKVFFGQDVEANTNSPKWADVWTAESCAQKAKETGENYVFQPPTAAKPFAGCEIAGSKPTPPSRAAGGGSTPAPSPIVTDTPGALECINAGWITQNDAKKCSYAHISKGTSNRYDKEFVQSIVKDCKSNEVACNPLTFGYLESGKTKCFPPTGSRTGPATNNAQKATHFGGPCDVVNPLTSDAFTKDANNALNEFKLRNANKYASNRDAQLAAIEEDQAKDTYAKTQQYLDSVLKHNSKGTMAELLDGKTAWNKEIDDLLVQTQESFEKEINRAIEICEKTALNPRQKDKANQQGACDQLHRRWLFAEQFISKYRQNACPAPTQYLFSLSNEVNNNVAGKTKNKTGVDKLNAVAGDLPCGCTNPQTKEMLKFPFGLDPSIPEKCNAEEAPIKVETDTCRDGFKENRDEAGNLNSCECIAKPGIVYGPQRGEDFIQTMVTKCEAPAVVKKCEQYDEAFRSQLDDDCMCKNKKGDSTKKMPKKVNTGFKAIFTSSKNNSDKQEDGKRYTCNQGPNWWVIGGIGAGIAGILALLLINKKKCPKGTIGKYPNCKKPPVPPGPVCPAGTTGTPPNCTPVVTCEPPRTIIDGVCKCEGDKLWAGFECQCGPCPIVRNNCGQPIEQTQNPVSCSCTPVPQEGGCGTNPNENGGGWGGTGQ